MRQREALCFSECNPTRRYWYNICNDVSHSRAHNNQPNAQLENASRVMNTYSRNIVADIKLTCLWAEYEQLILPQSLKQCDLQPWNHRLEV